MAASGILVRHVGGLTAAVNVSAQAAGPPRAPSLAARVACSSGQGCAKLHAPDGAECEVESVDLRLEPWRGL